MSEPTIVVEPTLTGRFAVTVRPLLKFKPLERAFPIAWQALEYADLIGSELDCPVLDRTGVTP